MYIHSSDTQIASYVILISKLHYYYPLRNATTLDSRGIVWRVASFSISRDRRRR